MPEGARGASAPSRSIRFEVEAKGVTPVWEQYAGRSEDDRLAHAGGTHIQQAFATSGTLRVGDDEFRLGGARRRRHAAVGAPSSGAAASATRSHGSRSRA